MIGATTTEDNDLVDDAAERDAYVGEKNAHTVIEYATITRGIVRELEEHIRHLDNTIMTQAQQITALQQQVAVMRGTMLGGGATT